MAFTQNYRFIEKDYWMSKLMENSEQLDPEQMEALLEEMDTQWDDLTFKFFEDGRVIIMDNATGAQVVPSQLRGASYDFYVRKRIAWIRTFLNETCLQSA